MVLEKMTAFRINLLVGGGAALVTLGLTMFLTWHIILRTIIHQQIILKDEDSLSYKLWRDTPVPQHVNFYFFNWLNPENVETEKPRFSQMGPYSFKVIEKKTNIMWNQNNTITFKIERYFYFDEENSNGTLDDELVSLNPVTVGASNIVRHADIFMKKGLSSGIWTTNQKVSEKKTVGEFLFYGYSNPLIDIGRNMPNFSGLKLPPYDKFAWFYKRNGSDYFDGTFNMDTGINDVYSIGKLRNWNYDNQTTFFPSTCSFINGSAGELYPPERTKSSIELFNPDLCRSISLSYAKEEEFHGVRGYKYVGDEYTFDNGTLDPNNECFCAGECSPSGVLNVTNCRYGAPGFVSFPHFHLADEFYTNQVEGLKPVAEKHNLYITLEPTSGIPLDVAARFQVNLLLTPHEDIGIYEHVPTIYFPIFWFEHRATITPALASELRLVLYRLPVIAKCVSVFCMVIGTVMTLCAIYLKLKPAQKNKKKLDIKMNVKSEEPLLT